MNQKNAHKLTLMICISIFLSIVGLSGCVNNNNNNQSTGGEDLSKFIGTWTGTIEMPMFGGRNNSNISSNITQLTFMGNHLVSVAITSESERGNYTMNYYTMNYSYSTEGDTLILEPSFNRGEGGPYGQPFNDTGQWNGTQPPNGTRQYNGTRQPYGGQQPPGGGRPSMSISFVYSFNEEDTILYLNNGLNGAQFIKIQ